MAVKFDPILDKIRSWDNIPQLNADPSSPKPESAWVTFTGVGGGTPLGLLLTLTDAGTLGYRLNYRTKEGTTVGVALS